MNRAWGHVEDILSGTTVETFERGQYHSIMHGWF